MKKLMLGLLLCYGGMITWNVHATEDVSATDMDISLPLDELAFFLSLPLEEQLNMLNASRADGDPVAGSASIPPLSSFTSLPPSPLAFSGNEEALLPLPPLPLPEIRASPQPGPMRGARVKDKFKCQACDKSFPRSDRLLAHSWIHVGIKPFSCDLCTATFSRKDRLKRHLAQHATGSPFVCPRCNRGFTHRHHLKKHERTFAGRPLHEAREASE